MAAARRAQPHSVRWTSPFEVEIRAHVERVLAGLVKEGSGVAVQEEVGGGGGMVLGA